MGLEEHTLEPVIQRTCEECGVRLTEQEIKASLDSDGRFLCTVHASDDVPVDERDDEPA